MDKAFERCVQRHSQIESNTIQDKIHSYPTMYVLSTDGIIATNRAFKMGGSVEILSEALDGVK